MTHTNMRAVDRAATHLEVLAADVHAEWRKRVE